LLSDQILESIKKAGLISCLLAAASLSACTFQPLYAPSASVDGIEVNGLSQVGVSEVDSRVGQQVRNHLLFLLHGGNDISEPLYDARLQVTSFERRTAANTALSDTTAGFVTVTTSYSLIDTSNQKRVAGGSRKASAYFDRTSQIFANQRAVRDAENRAGKEVAEEIRLAIASDLRR
jgi:LPS-assembly lipoprotein